MEIKKEEGTSDFENISVKYEFEDTRTENTDVHFSKSGGPIEIQQEFTIEKSEDGLDEDVFSIVLENDAVEQNNLKQPDVAVQETDQSNGKAHFVLNYEKTESSTPHEDLYTIVSRNQFYFGGSATINKAHSENVAGKNESFKDSNVLSDKSCVTERIDGTEAVRINGQTNNEDVIEIDDSSEEEDPLISTMHLPVEPGVSPRSKYGPGIELTTLSAAPTSADNELLFATFEKAMDDWYSKLSFHGPLKDCEIMESARQLAKHFNFEFLDDVEWVTMFKRRHQHQNSERSPTSNQNGVVDRHDDQHNSIENICKADKPSITNSNELIPSFKLKGQVDRIDPVADLLIRQRSRIPPARGAKRPMKADENRNVKSPKEISPILKTTLKKGRSNLNVIEGGNSHQSKISKFEDQLLEWYILLTSRHKIMLAASVFESKAVEIAKKLKLRNFRPSKTWLKQFLGRHGMWCVLSGKRVLFSEPAGGLLKARYDVEFEAWYYMFPMSPDYFLDNEPSFDEVRANVKNCLAGIFDWYLALASNVSTSSVHTAEAKFAEESIAKAAGLSSTKPVEEFYRDWCLRHEQFYKVIEEGYSLSSPVLIPNVLKRVSCRWAENLKLKGFTPQPMWMRRYLQINGLIYQENEVVDCYRFDPSTCHPGTFDRIFGHWLHCTPKSTEWLREALHELIPEKIAVDRDPLQVDLTDEPDKVDLTLEPDPPLMITRSWTLLTIPSRRIKK